MMKSAPELQKELEALIQKAIEERLPFALFSEQLLTLGMVRLDFDALKNERLFYTREQFVLSFACEDLKEDSSKQPWPLGEILQVAEVEKAIQALDREQITTLEFHRRLFAAGIVFCHVYLLTKTIYYLSSDGQYYLEKY